MAKVLSTAACVALLTPAVCRASTTQSGPPWWWVHDAQCIAYYESGNDVDDTANPYYRGLYQIGWAEWRSVGGQGDPANASWAEQTYRAFLLWLHRGWEPWETASLCGL